MVCLVWFGFKLAALVAIATSHLCLCVLFVFIPGVGWFKVTYGGVSACV